jgi:hypothetical protein
MVRRHVLNIVHDIYADTRIQQHQYMQSPRIKYAEKRRRKTLQLSKYPIQTVGQAQTLAFRKKHRRQILRTSTNTHTGANDCIYNASLPETDLDVEVSSPRLAPESTVIPPKRMRSRTEPVLKERKEAFTAYPFKSRNPTSTKTISKFLPKKRIM